MIDVDFWALCGYCAQMQLALLYFLGDMNPIDPHAPPLAEVNRNGDLVVRNVHFPLPSFHNASDTERMYASSFTATCLPPTISYPPRELTVSNKCYIPFEPFHQYRGRTATTKSGRPCKVRLIHISTPCSQAELINFPYSSGPKLYKSATKAYCFVARMRGAWQDVVSVSGRRSSPSNVGNGVQRWDEMDDEVDYTPWKFPAAMLESNFCRRPDLDLNLEPRRGMPWCYTDRYTFSVNSFVKQVCLLNNRVTED